MGAATGRAGKAGEEAAGAGERLPGTPPPDWARLPNEVLALILSWLPPETLATRCRLVCRRWTELLDGPAVWKLRWRREPAMRAALQAAARCPRLRWSRLGVLRPLGRNLVRNPCGREKPGSLPADQFRHWTVQCEFPCRWKVEENRARLEGAEAQTCFASSFQWCQKEQVIDLLKEGFWQDLLDTYQPDIVVSDWWGGRQDCGCKYELYVVLLAANKKRKIDVFEAKPDPIPQWNDASYQKVTHTFRRYGTGVRYILFRHRGKDTQFWKGHYGARVSNSSVVIQFSSESAESLEPGLSSAQSSQHSSPVLPPKSYF
ncbi:F-box only protein 27-like [Ahaetulla prasina]|uniref:F-box only protein 27-like n=1 Tax=Ahaetulla prasina TaxID=499056 RepID=UPI00264940CD|nr:F-box only protein 27-like [Ahaetulla prasina]